MFFSIRCKVKSDVLHFSQRFYFGSSLLRTFAEVLFPRKLIWIAGWFPSNQDPLSGNFVLRHAQAVANNLSTNSAFDSKLTVFHFPLFRPKQNLPQPHSDSTLDWRQVSKYNPNSKSKTTVYQCHRSASSTGLDTT